MLSKPSWLPLAEKLGLQDGRSRRVDHDCGSGRTLLLSREGPKLKAYCFRCNDGDSHTIEEPLHERIARLARQSAAERTLASSPVLPVLRGYADWPDEARLWLARAGLHSHDAGRMGAGYDEGSARLVLPCGPGFWQARALRPDQHPKYVAPDAPKVYPRYGESGRITLTEDILSAYKVGKVGEGWCMLGTSLPHELTTAILKSGKAVNVWLDNDLPPAYTVNRGQVAAKKVLKQLRALGVECRNIVTPQDPKLTTLDEIRKLTS